MPYEDIDQGATLGDADPADHSVVPGIKRKERRSPWTSPPKSRSRSSWQAPPGDEQPVLPLQGGHIHPGAAADDDDDDDDLPHLDHDDDDDEYKVALTLWTQEIDDNDDDYDEVHTQRYADLNRQWAEATMSSAKHSIMSCW